MGDEAGLKQSSPGKSDPFFDPYANRTDFPKRPFVNPWTEIRRDAQTFRVNQPVEPFLLYMEELESVMGSREGIQVSQSF